MIGLAFAAVASAQATPSASEVAAAREAFGVGVRAMRRGDWAAAHEEFARAYALDPRPRTLLNLAGAQSNTGRLVEAAESYRTFVAQARQSGGEDAAVRAAEQEIAELERRIPRARIGVTGLLESDELRLDGRPLSSAIVGTALPLNPGDHRLAVVREGAELVGTDFRAIEGMQTAVSLDVPPPPEPEPIVEPPPVPLPPPVIEPGPDVGSESGLLAGSGSQGPVDEVDDGSPFGKWWFWTIVGVVVITAIVTTGVVIANSANDHYVGNLNGGDNPQTIR